VDFEYLFFFSKKPKYYFETQREPHTPESLEDLQRRAKNKRYDINYQMKTGSRLKIGVGYGDGEHGSKHYDGKGLKQYDRKGRDRGEFYHPEGRNKRTVWTINPKPFGEGVCEHCGHYSKPTGKVEKEGFFGGEQNVERICEACEACRKPMTKTHFAVFPEELIETPIKAGSKKNSLVLDCFFGSGTTGMTALKLGRKFVGIDVSEEYVKLAEARLKPFKEQKKLFEY
jgi:DNA modification methylase